MRPRRRYLAVRILTRDFIPSESEFRTAIWHQLQDLYGELGVSRIGFWLVFYEQDLGLAIIRCQHDQVRPLRAALATVSNIRSTQLLLFIIGVSGTIQKAKTFLPELADVKLSTPRKRR